MDRLIKIELDSNFPMTIFQAKVEVEELIETEYDEANDEIINYVKRYNPKGPFKQTMSKGRDKML